MYHVIDDAFAEWDGQTRLAVRGLGRRAARAAPGSRPSSSSSPRTATRSWARRSLVDERRLRWVAQLAVAREHRGRGLARALLVQCVRARPAGGLRARGLDTDARTGARGLYEHVGMHIVRTDDGVHLARCDRAAAPAAAPGAGWRSPSVNLFTGAPLLAIWVGARVQGDAGGLTMTAVLV